jgi:hypothetical protein
MNNIHHPRSTRPSAPYATPPGTEERTFELAVDSIYELWLVTTFTAWFGEEFWATSPLPFKGLHMKLTFKEKTLTLAGFRWLLERVFRLQRGSEALSCTATRSSQPHHDAGPGRTVLETLAEMVHLYLAEYNLSALLADAPDMPEPLALRVLNKVVPTAEEDLETHEAYLRVCLDCVRLTYIDEASYLAEADHR